jgi:hypothetical protein
MLRQTPSSVFSICKVHGRTQTRRAAAEGRCVLAVASLCAASASFLILGLFVALILIQPSGGGAARVIPFLFLTLIYGGISGVHALKRANHGAALYGGEGLAVAGVILNSLPAIFVVIWVCIAVLPIQAESYFASLQDGCSSIAQQVTNLAGR